ncbi:hypothetical protein COCMIDRAFT_73298, partial [Bipolaris oryzae ATCC 44560]
MSLPKQLALLVSVSRPLSWVVAPAIWFSGLIHSGKYELVAFGVNDVYDYTSDSQNRRKTSQWTDGTALDQHHHRYVLLAAKISTALVLLITFSSWRKSSELFSCIVA